MYVYSMFSNTFVFVADSGGRDLSGNKRTNKTQSFDQKFDKSNEALRVSCKKGYPVRVVRYVTHQNLLDSLQSIRVLDVLYSLYDCILLLFQRIQ